MDIDRDGGRNSIKGRGMVFDVSSFNNEHQAVLEDMMHNKFGCEVSFHRRSTSNTKLYIRASSAPHFCNLVRPFMIPSMLYKLTC
jgi:hypothetical protein